MHRKTTKTCYMVDEPSMVVSINFGIFEYSVINWKIFVSIYCHKDEIKVPKCQFITSFQSVDMRDM